MIEVKLITQHIKGQSKVQKSFLSEVVRKTNGKAIAAVVSSVAEAIEAVEKPGAISRIDAAGYVVRD